MCMQFAAKWDYKTIGITNFGYNNRLNMFPGNLNETQISHFREIEELGNSQIIIHTHPYPHFFQTLLHLCKLIMQMVRAFQG